MKKLSLALSLFLINLFIQNMHVHCMDQVEVENSTPCIICKEALKISDSVQWNCHPGIEHCFHQDCIQSWFDKGEHECPGCISYNEVNASGPLPSAPPLDADEEKEIFLLNNQNYNKNNERQLVLWKKIYPFADRQEPNEIIQADDSFITHCNHHFNKEWLTQLIHENNDTCPSCDAILTPEEIFKLCFNLSTCNFIRQATAELSRSFISCAYAWCIFNRFLTAPIPIGLCETFAFPAAYATLRKISPINRKRNLSISICLATAANLSVAQKYSSIGLIIPRLLENSAIGVLQSGVGKSIDYLNYENPVDKDFLKKIRDRHKVLKLMKLIGGATGLYAGYRMQSELHHLITCIFSGGITLCKSFGLEVAS